MVTISPPHGLFGELNIQNGLRLRNWETHFNCAMKPVCLQYFSLCPWPLVYPLPPQFNQGWPVLQGWPVHCQAASLLYCPLSFSTSLPHYPSSLSSSEDLVKVQILNQQVWGGARDSAFSQVPWGCNVVCFGTTLCVARDKPQRQRKL